MIALITPKGPNNEKRMPVDESQSESSVATSVPLVAIA